MATQTPTQRSAAAKRAAATRKRNAAKRSASATRRTAGSQAAQTAERTADAAGAQLGAVATSAERVLFTAVGAVATAADAVKHTASTYTNSRRLARRLDEFELRGARLLDRNRRKARPRAR
jgi:hypothetical protein